MMARLRISDAARLAGISRATMNRALNSGRVSFETDRHGHRWIDAAEIARAFPDTARIVPETAQRDVEIRSPGTNMEREIALLRELIEVERARVRELVAERDRLLGMLEVKLLEQRIPWWRKWR